MSITKENASEGIGFFGLLTIVFIVMKLLGKLDWSWWWVLCPIWFVSAIVFSIVLLVGIGLGGIFFIEFLRDCKLKWMRKAREKSNETERRIREAEKKAGSQPWKS